MLIMKALNKQIKCYQPKFGNCLIIYLAGHGKPEGNGVEFDEMLKFTEVYDCLLESLRKAEVGVDTCKRMTFIFFFDSCYSGEAIERFQEEAESKFETKAFEKGMGIRVTICSATRPDQKAKAKRISSKTSAFTQWAFTFNEDTRNWMKKLIRGKY